MKKKKFDEELNFKEEPQSTVDKEHPDPRIDLFGGPHKKKKNDKWKEEFLEELEKMQKEE